MLHGTGELILIVALTFFVAGTLKGIIGIGLPMIAIPVLSLYIDPAKAAALLLVPIFFTNIIQVVRGPAFASILRRLVPLLLCCLVSTYGATWLIAGPDDSIGRMLLGIAVATYGVFALSGMKARVKPAHERWVGAATGICTGVIAGSTGIFLVPLIMYLQALDLDKEEFVQALSLTFMISVNAFALGLATHGMLSLQQMLFSCLALVPATAGLAVRTLVRSRIRTEEFHRVFCVALIVMGGYLVVSSFTSG